MLSLQSLLDPLSLQWVAVPNESTIFSDSCCFFMWWCWCIILMSVALWSRIEGAGQHSLESWGRESFGINIPLDTLCSVVVATPQSEPNPFQKGGGNMTIYSVVPYTAISHKAQDSWQADAPPFLLCVKLGVISIWWIFTWALSSQRVSATCHSVQVLGSALKHLRLGNIWSSISHATIFTLMD